MSHLLPTISALGTSWWIEIFDELPNERYTVIHDDCAAFLHRFETRYSRFKPDSLLSQLNMTGRISNPDVEFRDIITYALAQYARTAGIFNIMVGETLVKTGYDADYSFSATDTPAPIPNPNNIITTDANEITLMTGTIDFGGFGKGYAIDRIAELLQHTYGIHYFLVNGGGDMFGTSDHDNPITIYLEHPTEPHSYLETTTLKNQGFAASSPHKRAWKHADKTYTHIIRTNPLLPAPTALPDATFIKAATACDADIFATVALLIPATKMDEFAKIEQLGVASFYLESGLLAKNKAFM
jgi:thiamine biosynthesis lipoprotein